MRHARNLPLYPDSIAPWGRSMTEDRDPLTIDLPAHAETHTLDGSAPPVEHTLPTAPLGYSVLGVLGRGGMGAVYKARQLALNREVAIKVVLAGAHAGPQQRDRFLREAEAAAR